MVFNTPCSFPTCGGSLIAITSVSIAENSASFNTCFPFIGSETISRSTPYSVVSAKLNDTMLILCFANVSVTFSRRPSRFSINTDNCLITISITLQSFRITTCKQLLLLPTKTYVDQLHVLPFHCFVQLSLAPQVLL